MMPNSTAARDSSAAATTISSSQAWRGSTAPSSRGTSAAAMTKISELAQKSSCAHTRSIYRQFPGRTRTRAIAPAVNPALATATTPDTCERVLADDVDDVGQRQRQRHLGGARTAEPGQRGAEQPSRDRAEHEAADKCRHEFEHGIRDARLHAARQHRDENAEQDDRGGVVEQAFAFEKTVQARRRAKLAKDRDDRRRIGRRDNRPEQQADGQRNAGKGQTEPDRRGRREDGEDRQRQDRSDIPGNLPQIDRQRRVEQQQRQKDGQKYRCADRKIGERPGDFEHGFEPRMIDEKRRYAADQHADAGEQHRERHVQACGERLDRADDDQKRRNDEGCARDRMQCAALYAAATAANRPEAASRRRERPARHVEIRRVQPQAALLDRRTNEREGHQVRETVEDRGFLEPGQIFRRRASVASRRSDRCAAGAISDIHWPIKSPAESGGSFVAKARMPPQRA